MNWFKKWNVSRKAIKAASIECDRLANETKRTALRLRINEICKSMTSAGIPMIDNVCSSGTDKVLCATCYFKLGEDRLIECLVFPEGGVHLKVLS